MLIKSTPRQAQALQADETSSPGHGQPIKPLRTTASPRGAANLSRPWRPSWCGQHCAVPLSRTTPRQAQWPPAHGSGRSGTASQRLQGQHRHHRGRHHHRRTQLDRECRQGPWPRDAPNRQEGQQRYFEMKLHHRSQSTSQTQRRDWRKWSGKRAAPSPASLPWWSLSLVWSSGCGALARCATGRGGCARM